VAFCRILSVFFRLWSYAAYGLLETSVLFNIIMRV
jgi:hypothetical protein